MGSNLSGQINDSGLLNFTDFAATDPAGNILDYDNQSVSSTTTVTMDTDQPFVSLVALSTDNQSVTLYDNAGNALTNDLVARAGDNVTLKFETSERIIDPLKLKINGLEKVATAQLGDYSGMKWQASYLVQDNDTGLLLFNDFSGTNPGGANLVHDNLTVSSVTSVTMDTEAPFVSAIALSTDNLSKTLYDNVTGLKKPDDLVVLFGDNVTLKFESSERVFDPKVKINGLEKHATPQFIDNGTDTTGIKWQTVYDLGMTDNGPLIISDFSAADVAGNLITYDNNTVTSVKSVTMDTIQPAVTSVELSTDNLSKVVLDNQSESILITIIGSFWRQRNAFFRDS